MKRIAIIPARGGSKRIPKKNIKDFCGKPIISYVLDIVKKSNLFDVIHVSTDSKEIAAIVESLGFSVDFMRTQKLSDDHTPIMPVLKYVCEEYVNRNQFFDQVWLLMPTAPFLEPKDLTTAEKLFIQAGSNASILGVSTYQAPIEWAFDRESNGKLVPIQAGMFAKRSQDLKEKYFDTGSFALFSSRAVLESEGAGNDFSFIGQVLPKYKAIDIDTLDDWKLAEALYKGLKA
jgi:N-acylneuraminate cytidylyltransferase